MVAPAPPSAILPTVRISFTPGAAVATKSRRAGQRTDAGEQRELQLELQVLLAATPRCPSTWRTARARPPRGSNAVGSASKTSARLPLASTSHDQRALALAGGEQAERGGDAGLADAALAGDEQQPAVEQVEVAAMGGESGARRRQPRRSRSGARCRGCRARRRRSCRRARRPRGRGGRSATASLSSSASALSMRLLIASRSASSGSSTSISLTVWITPMRTSTQVLLRRWSSRLLGPCGVMLRGQPASRLEPAPVSDQMSLRPGW